MGSTLPALAWWPVLEVSLSLAKLLSYRRCRLRHPRRKTAASCLRCCSMVHCSTMISSWRSFNAINWRDVANSTHRGTPVDAKTMVGPPPIFHSFLCAKNNVFSSLRENITQHRSIRYFSCCPFKLRTFAHPVHPHPPLFRRFRFR